MVILYKIRVDKASPRCQAMTARRTRCRRTANCTMFFAGRPDKGIHEACELHWEHPPRQWWPK